MVQYKKWIKIIPSSGIHYTVIQVQIYALAHHSVCYNLAQASISATLKLIVTNVSFMFKSTI